MEANPTLGITIDTVLIFLAIRFVKDDKRFAIPTRWRLPLAFALGLVGSVVARACAGAASGMTWRQAIGDGLLSACLAVVAHETGIETLRGGKELPIPGFTVDLEKQLIDAIPTPDETITPVTKGNDHGSDS